MPQWVNLIIVPIITGALAGAVINGIIEFCRAKRRRTKILSALKAQLASLPRINLHNTTATNPTASPHHVLPMPYPTESFEIAIFSDGGIDVKKETAQATIDYLLKANELNILIKTLHDFHLQYSAIVRPPDNLAPTKQFLYDQANNEMSKVIKSLTKSIEDEKKWWQFWK